MSDPVVVTGPPVALPAELGLQVGPPVPVQPVRSSEPVRVAVGAGGGAGLWTGEGPPGLIIGMQVGDEYIDTLTGTIYRLNEG